MERAALGRESLAPRPAHWRQGWVFDRNLVRRNDPVVCHPQPHRQLFIFGGLADQPLGLGDVCLYGFIVRPDTIPLVQRV